MSYGMDTKSSRLKLVSLLVTALLFSNESIASDYISSAQKYLKKNDTNAAMIELKNAIQKSPEEALPRYLIGKIYLEQGNYPEAEKELSRALKYGHSAKEALPYLARAYLNQNKLQDVLLLVEEFDNTDSLSPDLFAIAAIAEVRLGNLDSATRLLEKSGNETLYAKLAHATYLTTTDQNDTAYEEVNALLKTAESNSDVWQLKGHIEAAKHDFDAAYESYLKSFTLSPSATQNAFFMANALVQGKRFEEAKPLVEKLLKANSQGMYVNELYAIILYAEKDYTAAKLHADKALNSGSRSLRASTISGISAYQLGQIEQANRIFTKISPDLPADHLVNRLYSITQLKLGYIDEAIKSLSSFEVKSEQDRQFISQASMELAKVGRHKEALQLAQKASASDNSQVEASLGLIKLANNDISGIEDLTSALEDDPSMQQAKQGLVNYYLSRRMFADAESIADKWLEQQPDDTTALVVKGMINKEQGNLDLAKNYFEQIRKNEPNNVQAMVELADIESTKGNTKEALSLLVDAKAIAPNNYKVNAKFLEFSKQQDRLPDAIKTLDEQIKADPFNSHLKIQKAHALILSDDTRAAINLLESLPHADKSASVYQLLGNLYSSLGKIPETKRNYQQWLDMAPYDTTAYIRNIQALGNNDEIYGALTLTRKAESVFPDDPRFSLIRAELYFKDGDLKNAQRTLDTMPENIRNTTYALELQGSIYVAQQEFSAAVDAYKKNYAVKPNIQSARKLASIYSLNDQNAQAIDFLNDVIEEHGEKAEPLRLKLAELQIKSHPDKALEQYKTIISQEPNNALALNNIAWLYLDKDQPKQACEYAQKAYEIANRSFEIADTYGYCLLKTGDTARALELLELAYNSRKQNAEIALHFAEALLSDRQIEQASKVLSSVDTEDPQLVSDRSLLNEKVKSLAAQ